MALTIVPFDCKLDQGPISKGDIIYHRSWTENKVVVISKVAGLAILFFAEISCITVFFQTFFSLILPKEVANILSTGCKIKEFLSTHERGEIYTTEEIFKEYLEHLPGIGFTENLNINTNKLIRKYTFEKLS